MTGVVDGWFDPSQVPRGRFIPMVLVYKCAHPARLEWIRPDNTWDKTFQYRDQCNNIVTCQEGEPTGGLLRWWVQFRTRHPDHQFFQHYRVWGQSCAWQDAVVSCWLVQHVAEHTQHAPCIHTVDCLAAQWSEPVLHESWVQNHIQLPIMPDATAYLQAPDTHWNAPFKADIRGAKEAVQHLGEVGATQQGKVYNAQWGLSEMAEVLTRAAIQNNKRNDKSQSVLRAGIENQLFIYRPTQHGFLQLVSDQEWFHQAGLQLQVPSKGIRPVWPDEFYTTFPRVASRFPRTSEDPRGPPRTSLDPAGPPWPQGPGMEGGARFSSSNRQVGHEQEGPERALERRRAPSAGLCTARLQAVAPWASDRARPAADRGPARRRGFASLHTPVSPGRRREPDAGRAPRDQVTRAEDA